MITDLGLENRTNFLPWKRFEIIISARGLHCAVSLLIPVVSLATADSQIISPDASLLQQPSLDLKTQLTKLSLVRTCEIHPVSCFSPLSHQSPRLFSQ